MNTSDERGPGVPDELRERCIRALGGPAPILDWGILVDVILAEIDAAGYVLVPADRLERLRGSHAQRYASVLALTVGMPEDRVRYYLHPWYEDGDLDPNESPR